MNKASVNDAYQERRKVWKHFTKNEKKDTSCRDESGRKIPDNNKSGGHFKMELEPLMV